MKTQTSQTDGWCPTCKGSGSGKAMTRHLGPDDYEVEVECPDCKGTGAGTVPLTSPATHREVADILRTYAESFASDSEGLHLLPEAWNTLRKNIELAASALVPKQAMHDTICDKCGARVQSIMGECRRTGCEYFASAVSETPRKPVAWRWRIVSTDEIPWLYATEKPNNLNDELFWDVEPLFAASVPSATPCSGWVSVLEKLPETHGDVLVAHPTYSQSSSEMYGITIRRASVVRLWMSDKEDTSMSGAYWQHLPKGPA